MPNYNEALFLRAVDEFFLGREAAAENDFKPWPRPCPSAKSPITWESWRPAAGV